MQNRFKLVFLFSIKETIFQYTFTSMYMEYQIKMYIYVYFSNKPNGGHVYSFLSQRSLKYVFMILT